MVARLMYTIYKWLFEFICFSALQNCRRTTSRFISEAATNKTYGTLSSCCIISVAANEELSKKCSYQLLHIYLVYIYFMMGLKRNIQGEYLDFQLPFNYVNLCVMDY